MKKSGAGGAAALLLLLAVSACGRSGAGDGESAEHWGELGNGYHVAERLDAAVEAYGHAGRLAPGDARWPYYEGMVRQARGEWAEAAACYGRVLEIAPGDLAAWLRLAEAELRRNRLDAAREAFSNALDLDPASAAGHYGLARLASIDGEAPAAVRHLEAALASQPEAASLHYPLAQAYRRAGEDARAQAHLAQRGEREVRFADPLAERLSETKTLTAFALVESLAGDPERLSDEDFLGFVLEQIGEVAAAPEQLTRLLERGPPAPAAGGGEVWRARLHYAVGGLLARRGDDADAVRHFAAAYELRPALRDARLRLANSLARLKRFDGAEAHYSALLAADPASGDILLKRATARLELGRLDGAAEDLRRLLAADPGGRDGARALAIAEALMRADPSLSNAETLAMALAEVGRFEEAAEWQRRLLAEASRYGHHDQHQRLSETLARYQRGATARDPR